MTDLEARNLPRLVWARLRTPAGVHYAGLALLVILLLIASTRSWFFFDDFAFLVPSQEGNVWQPHVGHWSTVPFSIFLGLRGIFGLDAFLPFAVPVILAHVAFAHLMWRLMRRVGVDPWIATALGLLVTFFGAGGENILWAFQIGFIGAMAMSLGVILLLMRPRIGPWIGVAIVALSTLALASSGTALPILAVAAVVGWMRHGFLRTVAVFALPGLAYLAWYALLGRFAQPVGRASGLAEILLGVPRYAIEMLTEGWGRALPVHTAGPLLFLVLACWWVFSIRTATAEARVAFVLFVAAPLFALLTAYSRVGLGIDTAISSRYLYFVIPMMIPVLGLALTQAIRTWNLSLGPVLVLIGVVVIYNVGGMLGILLERSSRSAEARQQLSAALDLQDDYNFSVAEEGNRAPAPQWAPDVLLSDAQEWLDAGWLSIMSYDRSAELTARAVFGLDSAPGDDPRDFQACRILESDDPAITVDGSTVLLSSTAEQVRVALSDGTAVGLPRTVGLTEDWTEVSLDGPRAGSYDLVIEPGDIDVTVCAP